MLPFDDGCRNEIKMRWIVEGWKGHGQLSMLVVTPPPRTAARASNASFAVPGEGLHCRRHLEEPRSGGRRLEHL